MLPGPKRSLAWMIVAGCIVLASARVLVVDKTNPQGADEPGHVAAGLERLDRHTYVLDPLHPPFAREVLALPLYAIGERLPLSPLRDPASPSYTEVGNAILYVGGHYSRNLFLARLSLLLFLAVAIVIVFLWTKRVFGILPACFAAFLFSILPSILAFSSLAYLDVPAMCVQLGCLLSFAVWLEDPTWLRTSLVGLTAGIAISTKFTSLLFFPFAAILMFLARWLMVRQDRRSLSLAAVKQLPLAAAITAIVLWGCYGFSVGRLQDAVVLPTQSVRGLNIAPGPAVKLAPAPGFNGGLAKQLLRANPVVPAPDLIRGLVEAHLLNKTAPSSYLFEHERPGGWWFFFPLALALKTPLPFIILALIGVVYALRSDEGRSAAVMPLSAVLAILLVTMFVKYKIGTRHVLVVLPLLSIYAGSAAAILWSSFVSYRLLARSVLCLLLAWYASNSLLAQGDLLAFFNELAPRDASRALVKGCDLDCGQDVLKLGRDLQNRGVRHLNIGVWTTADLGQLGFPEMEMLTPNRPTSGWVAVSVRTLRTGQVVFIDRGFLHGHAYAPDAFQWLERYKPVAQIGKTVLLYNIPDHPSSGAIPETK
jgi:hypothetical protein